MRNVITSALILCWALAAAAQMAQPPAMTADEVMAKVFVRDRQREKVSQGYTGNRRYIFDNRRLHKHSEMLVSVKGDPIGAKHFEVVSEEGWKSANTHVLRKMLASETETSGPAMRAKTLLTPDNYNFSLLQIESVAGRPTYVIAVTPRRHDKYLFEGQIWIDAVDYALVRATGKPASNPSFWTRSIHFVHQYQKSGEFWFPSTTESVTQAWMFGRTEVTIRYFDYVPNMAPERNATATPEKASFSEANYVKNR
jgi:hypothetical protein